MTIIIPTEKEKKQFNLAITHPQQSYEWGEFRKAIGTTVIRKLFVENNKTIDAFSMTIHPIPHTSWTIGYIAKGNMPSKEVLAEIQKVGQDNNCIFVQIEPHVMLSPGVKLQTYAFDIRPSAHPLFTKFTFMLNLTKSEEEMLASMHAKTRYNIRVAMKHGVTVTEDNSEKGFETYWQLMKETTTRQKFYAHTKEYHKKQWQTINVMNNKTNELQSHILLAVYKNQPLTAWTLFIFKDTLYYPYGASSNKHREVMASTQMMWEVIRFGKKLGLKKFDMWGALGKSPDTKDPWFGFHQFKERFGPEHVEFIGSYDIVLNSALYEGYKVADKFRSLLLQLKK